MGHVLPAHLLPRAGGRWLLPSNVTDRCSVQNRLSGIERCEVKPERVEPICQVLRDADVQIAPSTYYAAKSRPLSARGCQGRGADRGHPSGPRGKPRCERLMRAAGIQGIRRDKTRKITCGDGAETDRLAASSSTRSP